MPFTKTPMQSTEQTKTVSLLYNWDSRNDGSDNFDTRLENVLTEPIGKEYVQMLKRDGSVPVPLPTGGSGPFTGPLLGFYYWSSATANPIIVAVFLNEVTNVTFCRVYSVSISNGAISFVSETVLGAGIGTSRTTKLVFQEFLYDIGTIDLFFAMDQNASVIWKVTTAGVVTSQATAANTTGTIVFLDGYIFRGSNQDIFNSNLNDPTTWSASNFISVESYADKLLDLARVGTYIVAFSQDSIQYFYDAGNPTGSPLSVVQGATKNIGYLGGLASAGDDIYFIGEASGAPSLYKLSGLRVTPVDSLPFARVWNTNGGVVQFPLRGRIVSLNGHTLYYVEATGLGSAQAQTYVYDLDSGAWSFLSYQNTSSMWVTGAQTFTLATGFKRECYFCLWGDQNLYKFSSSVYQDNAVNFTAKFRTPRLTFDTRRNKFGARLVVDADQTSSSSLFNVSWTDDDYQTFSTPRTLNLADNYQQMYALGSFRARSFVFTYTDNFPMRWKSIELDYDQGSA